VENKTQGGDKLEVEIQPVKTITPAKAAAMMHKNAEYIRAGLRQNRFSFGTAVQSKSGRWNYCIIESKFLNYLNK